MILYVAVHFLFIIYMEFVRIKTLEFYRSASPTVPRKQPMKLSLRKYAKPILFDGVKNDEPLRIKLEKLFRAKPNLNVLAYNEGVTKKGGKSKNSLVADELGSTHYVPFIRQASPMRSRVFHYKKTKPVIKQFVGDRGEIGIEGKTWKNFSHTMTSFSPEPKPGRNSDFINNF